MRETPQKIEMPEAAKMLDTRGQSAGKASQILGWNPQRLNAAHLTEMKIKSMPRRNPWITWDGFSDSKSVKTWRPQLVTIGLTDDYMLEQLQKITLLARVTMRDTRSQSAGKAGAGQNPQRLHVVYPGRDKDTVRAPAKSGGNSHALINNVGAFA